MTDIPRIEVARPSRLRLIAGTSAGHRARGRLLAGALVLVFLGTSCTMIPPMVQSEAPVAKFYPQASSRPASGKNVRNITWRKFFSDPLLQRYIEIALENNRDLRIAALNVESARAQYRIQRSEFLPEIGGSSSVTRGKMMGNMQGSGAAFAFPSSTYNQFEARVGITAYELDLFGRIRSSNQKALEQYFALTEAQRAVHIALMGQVAIQYLAIREYEEQLALARRTLNSVESGRDLIVARVEAGTATESDLASIDVQVQSARVDIHRYERMVGQAKNTLVELLGQPLPNGGPTGRALNSQNLVADLSAGLPSDLLTNRPDILAAEHQLHAANADIGVARAAFFPTISLTSSTGSASAELSNLFGAGSHVWNFSPQITVPIFTGGRNRANLDVAELRKEIEIANYEKTIQIAFREVSDALVARSGYIGEVRAQQDLVRAQQKRFDLARLRYSEGVVSYLEVLMAQQDLYASQKNSISIRAEQLVNLVSFYKALGGGWE